PDDVGIQNIFRSKLRQRQIRVDEVLGVLVDAAGGDDVGDVALRVAEGLAGQRVVDDGWSAHGDAIADKRFQQRGKSPLRKTDGNQKACATDSWVSRLPS